MKNVLIGVVIALALLAGVAGVGIGGYALKTAIDNQPVTAIDSKVETDLTKVAGYSPDAKAGDVVAPLANELKGGNTRLIWETGKVQAGARHDFDGTWTSLGGAVVYNPQAKSIKALEVNILIESFNTYGSEQPAPGGLINTVLGKGKGLTAGESWFNYADHPNAVYTATEFVAVSGNDSVTHTIKGSFDLNGKTQALDIPAKISFSGEEVVIDAKFSISRSAYGIEPVKAIPLTEVDDAVAITAVVKASPNAGVSIDAIAQMLGEQGTQIAAQQKINEELTNQLAMISAKLDSLERKIASGVGTTATTPQVDVANLPKSFTEKVQYPGKEPIPFDMVLVPGDAAAGVAPFYMASKEVTWAMFYNWAYGSDIDANTYASMQKQNLRPSPLYEDCDQLKLGLGNRPAVSMSRTTAEAFAKWLSEQTGRSFRIPTDAEWQTALKLGGGIPDSREVLFEQGVFKNNAEEQLDPPFLWLTGVVGSKKPNALGIYDMLGNAAEWVTDTGAQRLVRGGHFMQDLDEVALTAEWKEVEDQKIWNETYPQEPKSRFWYRDFYFTGIRLVCDPQ